MVYVEAEAVVPRLRPGGIDGFVTVRSIALEDNPVVTRCDWRRPEPSRAAEPMEALATRVVDPQYAPLLFELADRPVSLITPVADRPGHDRRYALDTGKLRQLGWAPQVPFERGLADTVAWYRANEWWWRPIKEQDAAFTAYYAAQYGSRPRA